MITVATNTTRRSLLCKAPLSYPLIINISMHPDHSNYDLSSVDDDDPIFSLNYPVSRSQLSASFNNLNIQDNNNISRRPNYAPIRASHSASRFNPVAVSSVTRGPSFSPSGVDAFRSLSDRSLNPTDGSGDYLSSPSLPASISTAVTPPRATSPAPQVLDPSPYILSIFSGPSSAPHLPLSLRPLTQPRSNISNGANISPVSYSNHQAFHPLCSQIAVTPVARSLSVLLMTVM